MAGLVIVPRIHADGLMVPPVGRQVMETGQQAVIWHNGTQERLILSTTFRGDAEDFVWIVPVPSRPEVGMGKDELFTSLASFTTPRDTYQSGPLLNLGSTSRYEVAPDKVTVLETKRVDIYDTAVLEASDAKALREWLEKAGYPYPDDKDHLLAHYVQKNWYFVVAKIADDAAGYASSYLREGHATPLSLTFDTTVPVYPLKISGPSSKGADQKAAAYSFEKGLENWTQSSVGVGSAVPGTRVAAPVEPLRLDSTTAYHGTNSLAMSGNSRVTVPFAHTWITVNAGKPYVATAYVRSPGAVSGNVRVEVWSAGAQLSQSSAIVPTSQWKPLEVKFTPTASGVYVRLSWEGGAEGQKVVWDAVQVEQGSSASAFTVEKLPQEAQGTDTQPVGIVLYVLSDHKQTAPGFAIEYAGQVQKKTIEGWSMSDGGEPWMTVPGKKLYLTKLTARRRPAEMSDDVMLRKADDDTPAGAGVTGYSLPVKAAFILGIPLLVEVVVIGYYLSRKKK